MSLAASKRTKPSKTPLVLQTLVPVFPTYLNTQGFGFVTRSDGADFFMHIKASGDVRASYRSVVANLQTTLQWAQRNLSRSNSRMTATA
eukprot:s10431_g1.t2